MGVASGLALGVGEAGAGAGAVGEGVVGGGGGEALVEEVHLERASLLQAGSEGFGRGRAGAFGAVHVQWQAEDELDVVRADVLVDALDDRVDQGLSIASIDGHLDGRGGRADAGLVVTDSQACSLVAEVDREESHD